MEKLKKTLNKIINSWMNSKFLIPQLLIKNPLHHFLILKIVNIMNFNRIYFIIKIKLELFQQEKIKLSIFK